MSQSRRSFTSDNEAPVAAEVLAALGRVNDGRAHSYGEDAETARLGALACELFGTRLAIYPVATGTAANALALAALLPPYGAVYCCDSAHIHTDECGAPEFYSGGAKLLPLASRDGKLLAAQLDAPLAQARAGGVHHVQPAAVSLSQATEWGTVYRPEELHALASAAHAHGLLVHMDGARFANAVAHLGCTPAEASWRCGIDVLSFGATKNGALAAEAVVFFRPELARDFELRRKRAGQLWSKLRFLSAQLTACLEDGLWLRHAAHANALATRLAEGLRRQRIELLQPVEANEVFAALPAPLGAALRAQGFEFYDWPPPAGARTPCVRLVTDYDMQAADVDALLAAAAAAARPAAAGE